MSFAFIPPPFPFPEAWPHIFQTQQMKWLSPGFTLAPPPTSLYASYNGSSGHGAAHPSAPFPFYLPQSFVDPAVAFLPPHDEHDEHAHEAETQSFEHEAEESGSESPSSGDGEYVYGYVLSDEWRGRFRSSLQARQRQQQQQRSQRQREQQQQQKNKQASSSKTSVKQQSNNTQRKKTRKQQFFPSASDQRTMDLEREFAAAKRREASARRPIAPREDRDDALQHVRCLETQLNLRFDAFCDAFLPVVWPHDAVHK